MRAPVDLRVTAAEVLRHLALDESLKQRVAEDPALRALARRVADRYIGGDDATEALDRVRRINAAGHAATVDFMGESCRDPELAARARDEFLALSTALAAAGLNCSISLDLSHIGSLLGDVGRRNARLIAEATAAAGQELMISMEGSDRVDLVLDIHEQLSARFDHVGITLQARLHRTADDLPRVLRQPGRVRLVKGAYPEPESVAYPRGSIELHAAYLEYAGLLLRSGHPCSVATHDDGLLAEVHGLAQRLDPPLPDGLEFETLTGLGEAQLSRMRSLGYPTREYVVYGEEWWLYVCNRIAEDPDRIFLALADAMPAEGAPDGGLGAVGRQESANRQPTS